MQDTIKLDHIMTFGKHKGKTVAELMDEAPGWLVWAHENVEFFKLPPELIRQARLFLYAQGEEPLEGEE